MSDHTNHTTKLKTETLDVSVCITYMYTYARHAVSKGVSYMYVPSIQIKCTAKLLKMIPKVQCSTWRPNV